MFRDLPKNDQTISELIRELNLENHDDCQQTLKLYENTRNFLSHTAPQFQANREHWNEEKILSVLNAAAKALDDYAAALKSGGEREKEVYDYCKTTIEERLKTMKSDKDKIFAYYHRYDNRLKTILSSDHTSKHKLR